MKELSEEELKEAQRNYNRDYYKNNRENIRGKQQQWRKENPEKVKEYNRRLWTKKAMEQREESKI